ncbi:exported hypothetical protein [Methylocella tundrae]|uniref:Uncharacterized protein n=1 Tax=Methylocella tundrae TaxID=227605 RepID=A0A8B6M1Q9_METTU|nr:hypothetical protein [Methylocella tundrae]VTZ23255.1 exported hypothetical protein [Methylocella tundrae]VTZ48684.1 exported hypothetical protein [Methylocella tundrae]
MKILQLALVGALASATAGIAEAKQASSNHGASSSAVETSVQTGRSAGVSGQPAYNVNEGSRFTPMAPARGPYQVY